MSWLRGAHPTWVGVGALAGAAFGYCVTLVNDVPPPIYPPLFFGFLGILVAIDIQKMLLPTPWIILCIITAWANVIHMSIVLGPPGGFFIPILAIGFTIAYSGVMMIAWYLARQHVGLGDVKLSVALAPWLASAALANVEIFLSILCIASLAVALFAITTRTRAVPYGPVMVLATGLASVL